MSSTRVENAFSTWHKAMEKEAEFGALDTEPMYHASRYLRAGLINDDPQAPLPATAREWELYTSMPGAERAAKRLTAATRSLKEKLMRCPIEDLPFIRKCVGGI